MSLCAHLHFFCPFHIAERTLWGNLEAGIQKDGSSRVVSSSQEVGAGDGGAEEGLRILLAA